LGGLTFSDEYTVTQANSGVHNAKMTSWRMNCSEASSSRSARRLGSSEKFFWGSEVGSEAWRVVEEIASTFKVGSEAQRLGGIVL
jgi:hypothetical protein